MGLHPTAVDADLVGPVAWNVSLLSLYMNKKGCLLTAAVAETTVGASRA
jgi:hypothetical protein